MKNVAFFFTSTVHDFFYRIFLKNPTFSKQTKRPFSCSLSIPSEKILKKKKRTLTYDTMISRPHKTELSLMPSLH